jgi:hypothetical protein
MGDSLDVCHHLECDITHFGRKVLMVQRNVLPLSYQTVMFMMTPVKIADITLVIFYFDISDERWEQTLVIGSLTNRSPCID